MKQFAFSPIRSLSIAAALCLFMVVTPVAHAQTNLSPSSLSFAITAVSNNSAPKTLTLSNGGNAAINISGINMIGGDFDQTNNCGKSLAAKKSCTISVVFNPTGTGTRAALMSVSHSGGLQLALFSGTAISQTSISPASATFAAQPVNSSSAASAISLKNNQNVGLAISKISTTGDFAQSNNCGTSLAAGATCTISTTFRPTATGTRTGSVTVASNATPTTQSIALTGTGSAPVTVSPASLAFSTAQTVGVATAAQVITVKNLQAIALPISSTAVTGDYTQTNSCGSSLPAGASCAVNVVFKPTTAGNRTGTFSITNGAVGSPETVSLSGAGVAATVKSIAVTPATASIVKGKTQQFIAIATYTSGTTADITATATWTSSAATIASVSKGMATALATGAANMTASMTGTTVTGAASLTVTAPTLVSIAVTPNPVSVVKGKTQQFTATGTYSDGTTQNLTATATWTSATGATITAGGVATATAVGAPVITAKSGSIAGTATMTVQPATLVSIAVTPATAAIAKGKTQQYAATGTYTDGSTQALTSSVVWTSGAGASIVSGGLATGTGVGAPVITATSGTIAGTATLTVQPAALVSIAVTPATASIAKGLNQQYVATGTYTDNSTQVLSSVTWTATSGATITSAGLATGSAVSVPTITATSGAIQGTAALTVQPAALVSIAVTPATASIAKGLTQQFSATGTYTDSSTQNLTGSVTWSASAQASVASNGLATAMAVGTPTISATSGSISGAAILTVQPAALLSLVVTPSSATIVRGSTQQFIAQGTFTDASVQDISSSVSWSASAGASMVGGLATGTDISTPTVTANSGSISGSASLTVQAPALVSITVSPASVSLGLHSTQQFTAMGTYADNTTADITHSVVWNTGNSSVVSISGTGMANVLASSSNAIQISAISNGIASNVAWLSSLAELQPSCSAPTLDMKLLVVTNGQTEADFAAIKQGLDYLGTPYTVFDMNTQTGGITADLLSDGNCHGYYQGVIFTFGNYIYTLPGMPILNAYEQTYHVRQVNWFVYPDTNFGINTYHDSVDAYHPYTASFTPAAENVFSYANTDSPLAFSGAFIYLSTPVDGSVTPLPSGASVTPLLMDASGNALSVIYNLGDGREYLSQTFDSNQYLMHNLILSYGLINWVTKGVFLGEYHVYASPQVDDVFINDHEWAANTPCHPTDGSTDRTDSDADTLGTVRMAGTDVDSLVTWMTQKQQNPLLSNFVLHMAFNGVGTTGNPDLGGYNPDTLTPELMKYQSRFKWISHTYDHPDTLNSQTAAFDDDEILKNNQTAAALGLTYYNPANMVTPGVTGLNDPVYVNQAVADGVKYVVTDTSVLNTPNNGPNPSPNVGMPDTINNGLYLVPRHANNLYFNVATPGGWTAEYQCIYADQPQYAAFNYQNILDNISQSFVANMIKGDMDPQMFHQPNLVAYDGAHSLIGDLYDNTFNLYLSMFKLPVLSPTLDELGQSMQQRNQYNLSGVTASVVNAGAVDAAVSITVPSGTTVPSAVVPVTGLSSNGAENYAGQNISHITVSAGQTITLPLQ